MNSGPSLKVYGADWCGMTRRTLEFLDELGVPYEYIDVERDHQASTWVKAQSNGKERKPTLDVAGRVMVTPDDDELESALRDAGILAPNGSL